MADGAQKIKALQGARVSPSFGQTLWSASAQSNILPAMPLVLVISSYVAASRVGGGIAPYVLAPLKIDPVLTPTTLLGRHPGWGAPGGAAVDHRVMQGMLDGIEANGLFAKVDAILTGYFANAEQVRVAALAIDKVRRAREATTAPFVMVDPIMGDADRGLFVPGEVAAELVRRLAPRADLIACNRFEFEHLECDAASAADLAEAARDTGKSWLVGSMPSGDGIADVLATPDGSWRTVSPLLPAPVPKGTGDLLHLCFLGQRLLGADGPTALSRAVGAVQAILARAKAWDAPELPLAACQDILADPPAAPIETVD